MVGFLLALIIAGSTLAVSDLCLGEYQYCITTGECTLFQCDGPGPHCSRGQYRCPISNHCVDSAAALVDTCPGLRGTWLDHTISTEDRITKLIAHANLTEKIYQLTNAAPPLEHLGIPAYNWLADDEHGVRGSGGTYFPDGPGLGASFDKKLLHAVGAVVGLHNYLTHTTGMRDNAFNGDSITVYGPNMNLVKDPRWGRAQEVYSEDPRLSSALTIGYVTGIQGANRNGTQQDLKYLQAGACCKHLVAYDVEGRGALPSRVYFDADVDTRSFWEHYMPVFHDCIVSAKAMHAMCSYNSMNHVPTCADPNLMNGILREQWAWDGFVVSDYDAWANIFGTHHYTKDMEHAAAEGINAGMDQEGGGTAAIAHLQQAVADGLTTATTIDESFRRLMRMRIRLGMFDPPTLMLYNKLDKKDFGTVASTALNRLAAGKGMVLLKNGQRNGRPLLPLDASSLIGREGSLLVSGATADNGNNTLGNYACNAGNCSTNVTSVLGGIRNAQTGLDSRQVTYEPGCLSTNCTDSDFSKAVAAARVATVAVVVLGTLGWDEMKLGPGPINPNAYEKEGHDRTSLSLAGNQYNLAAQLSDTGTPLVCVLIHGGSIELGSLLDKCTSIVDAWFPGQQGGAGLADVLFGRVNPAGRSPQTYYSGDAELPKLGNMDLYAGNGTTYRYYNGTPTIPFGFGLSYTTFSYGNFKIGSTIGPCDSVTATVDVTNTGSIAGDEVVQLYVKTPSATVPAPHVRLADFERVHVGAGDTATVHLVITPKYHSVVHNAGKDAFWHPAIVVEKGPLFVYVGGGQPDFTSGVLSSIVHVTSASNLTTQYRC